MGFVVGRKLEPRKVPRVCGCGRLVPSMCFATMVVPVCVVLYVSCRGCGSHWNGCVKVA